MVIKVSSEWSNSVGATICTSGDSPSCCTGDVELRSDVSINAFKNCDGGCLLTSLKISTNVQSIGAGAFADCPYLGLITMGDSVVSIGSEAFGGGTCSNANASQQVYMPRTISHFNSSFGSCFRIILRSEVTTDCYDGLKQEHCRTGDIEIRTNLTEIGDSAFATCPGISSVIIPPSVTRIGPFAFKGLVSLRAVYLPSSISIIDAEAFLNATSL
jgi:hypothetical protein